MRPTQVGRTFNTDLFIMEFINLTEWPSQDQQQPREAMKARAKSDAIKQCKAHVLLGVEHHAKEEKEMAMCRQLRSTNRWKIYSAAAMQSDKSARGTFGGAFALAKAHLNTTAPAGAWYNGTF